MSKIDEISKRAFDEDGNYRGLNARDALFLLTRLGLAEKALEDIMETHNQPITQTERKARGTALLALQQLRE